MAAVPALPAVLADTLPDFAALQVRQKLAVTLLVMLLNGRHTLELTGNGLESLLTGNLRKFLVHLRPLLVLASGGRQQVLLGGANAAQVLEPQLGVLLLIRRSLLEKRRYLLKAFLLRLGGKVVVLVPGLGLPRKGVGQVRGGLASFQFHGFSPLFSGLTCPTRRPSLHNGLCGEMVVL